MTSDIEKAKGKDAARRAWVVRYLVAVAELMKRTRSSIRICLHWPHHISLCHEITFAWAALWYCLIQRCSTEDVVDHSPNRFRIALPSLSCCVSFLPATSVLLEPFLSSKLSSLWPFCTFSVPLPSRGFCGPRFRCSSITRSRASWPCPS